MGRCGDLFHGGGKCPPVSGCGGADRGPGARGGQPRDASLPILVPVAKTVAPGDPGVVSHAAGSKRRSSALLPATVGHVQPSHLLLDAQVSPEGGAVVAGFPGLVLHDSGKGHRQESIPLGPSGRHHPVP